MNNIPTIRLNKNKGRSILLKHPWIFSGAISPQSDATHEGDIVEVVTENNQFLAMGYTQRGSISVRIISFEKQEINANLWKEKLEKAYNRRKLTGLQEKSEIFRLVFGESDGFPGLIMDYYNGYVIYQAHTVFMFLIKEQIVSVLKEVLGDSLKGVYCKSKKTLPPDYATDEKDKWLYGETEKIFAKEYNIAFNIDFEKGQKTGFFIDQRENRSLLKRYATNKQVLNMCCYSGAFSAYALQGGASLVHSVDASERAIALTNENIALNFPNTDSHEAFVDDAFKYLEEKGNLYNLIILDPPAFAKHKKVITNATKGYRRLNRIAMEKIQPGGIIFSFSCSQVIDKELFQKTLFQAAMEAKKQVTILEHLTQPLDHPVSLFHPESAYLKGLILQVE